MQWRTMLSHYAVRPFPNVNFIAQPACACDIGWRAAFTLPTMAVSAK